ncbi:SPRY domain-containing protein [Paenibacillus taichungensis]|uniref:SPRY domain-containing protein n=1 Tax=Paenibacillus taichungensis TaxID=484184 RepID=UPI0039A1F45B
MQVINVTLNPSDSLNVTLSNNNLTTTSISSNAGARATHGKEKGKWYWEVKLDSGYNVIFFGVSNLSYLHNANLATDTNARFYYCNNGNKYPENVSYGTAMAIGDTIGVALDLDNGTLGFYKNGVSMGVSHTNIKVLGKVYPTIRDGSSSATKTATINFGSKPFSYPVPTGYFPYNVELVDKFLISSGDEYHSIVPEFKGTETAIPQMTSNTTPNGRAFSSSTLSSTYEAWRAFDRVDSGFYASENNSGGIGYLGYEFTTPIRIGKYALRCASTEITTRPPKDWTFEGSNDGNSWVILDTQANQIWSAVNTEKEYIIDYNKVNSYKMYRINWTSNGGYRYTEFNELKMYEYVSSKLINLRNQSEQTFINHGMNKGTSINLTNSNMLERRYIAQDSLQLGSGKVFKQKIDRSKHRAKKIILG